MSSSAEDEQACINSARPDVEGEQGEQLLTAAEDEHARINAKATRRVRKAML
jgi:hypothetical protein